MPLLRASFALGFVLMTSACATQDAKIDKKVAGEAEIQSRRDIQLQADYLIRSSKELSEEQKERLLSLRKETKDQLDDYQSESLKLRAVLMRAVLSPDYDAKEVERIKSRMKTVEDKKLARIFETVATANKIIGRNKRPANDEMFREFFIFDSLRTTH